MSYTIKRLKLSEIAVNVTLWMLALGFAYFWQADPAGFLWSIWLGSLLFTQLSLLSAVGGCLHGAMQVRKSGAGVQGQAGPVGICMPTCVFWLVIWTFGISVFHASYASFIASVMPLPHVGQEELSFAFLNPFRLWANVIADMYALGPLAFYLIAVERHHLRSAFTVTADMTIRALPAFLHEKEEGQEGDNDTGFIDESVEIFVEGMNLRSFLFNMMRMHAMIFIVLICDAMGFGMFWLLAWLFLLFAIPSPWGHQSEAQQTPAGDGLKAAPEE